MIIRDIKKYAKENNIKISGGMSKPDLIKKIQVDEGNDDCYKINWAPECAEQTCLWREDCLNGK